MSKRKVEVDFNNETFEDKIEKFLEDLEKDVKELQKQNRFHSLIVAELSDITDPETKECVKNVKDTIVETTKIIDNLLKRQAKAKTLRQFLKGDLVLDFDAFTMLMIEILDSQMVNYVELKQEFQAVSKKWVKK